MFNIKNYIPHWSVFVGVTSILTLLNSLQILIYNRNTIVSSNVACSIINTEVSQREMYIRVKCNDLEGEISNPQTIVDYFSSGKPSSVGCNTYINKSIRDCVFKGNEIK
jgi:hypothetical protein